MNLPKFIAYAIRNKKIVSLIYDGERRKVAPHILGMSSAGNMIVSAYQIKNFSDHMLPPEWRTFEVQKISSIEYTEETFFPQRDYNPDDSNFDKIIQRV